MPTPRSSKGKGKGKGGKDGKGKGKGKAWAEPSLFGFSFVSPRALLFFKRSRPKNRKKATPGIHVDVQKSCITWDFFKKTLNDNTNLNWLAGFLNHQEYDINLQLLMSGLSFRLQTDHLSLPFENIPFRRSHKASKMRVYESVWTSAPLLRGKSFGKKRGEVQATQREESIYRSV